MSLQQDPAECSVVSRLILTGFHSTLRRMRRTKGYVGGINDLPTTAMNDRTNAARCRVLIVDDHPLVQHGLRALLTAIGCAHVIGEAECRQHAIECVRKGQWDLVILGLNLPNWMGLDILRELKVECPSLPVLIFSLHSENEYAVRALQAGASEYVYKWSPPKEIIKVIKKAMAGKVVVPASFEKRVGGVLTNRTAWPTLRGLSDREFDVLCRLARGQTVKQIARELWISANTVGTYRARMFDKLHFRTTADLIRYALDHRLVQKPAARHKEGHYGTVSHHR